MKVLQIANDYLGTTLYVTLMNALGDVGVTNVIFVPVRSGAKYRKENDGLRNDNGSSLVISSCFNTLDRILFYSKQKKIYTGIRQTVDLNNISCVHAHTLFSAGYTAMKLKEDKNKPYIVAVRNVDVNIFFKKVKHLRNTGVEIMNQAEKVIFLSPAYKNTVLKNYVPEPLQDGIERKSLVIPNGISRFFLNNKPEAKTDNFKERKSIRIIYAGEINQNKNLTETIDACSILRTRGYSCSFTVVGNVTGRKCEKLLDEDFITHYPRCPHEELIKHYRRSDIFVMPSHTETFGLVYAEAMSQGLPVIYTRGQGFDGHFEEGVVGYSVSDFNATELADRIEAIIDDYESISRRCIENADKFDWNTIAGLYKNIYEEMRGNK